MMVMVFPDHDALTPGGNPVAVPMPVAPVVVCVIAVIIVPTHKPGVEDGGPAVFKGVTVMDPIALTLPQPPVRGIM